MSELDLLRPPPSHGCPDVLKRLSATRRPWPPVVCGSARAISTVLLTSLLLPVILMLLFVYLFGGASIATADTSPTSFRECWCSAPGSDRRTPRSASVRTCTAGSSTGSGRWTSAARRWLAGHVTASVARNVASTVLVFGVAFLIGFRTDATPAGWLAAGGILLLFIVAISWLAALVGLLAESPGGGERLHLHPDVPALRQQRFRPDRHDALWLQGFSGTNR